jgi:hypothetical protein
LIRPEPHPPLIAQLELAAKGLTDFFNIDRTLSGVMVGCMEYIRATTPDTTGAAIEVPSDRR